MSGSQADLECKAEAGAEVEGLASEHPARAGEELLPVEPICKGVSTENELLLEAASSTPGEDAAVPSTSSGLQAQTCAIQTVEEQVNCNPKGKSKSKGRIDKKAEANMPKELDAEGQKLLDAWEVFQENAQDRHHYFQ